MIYRNPFILIIACIFIFFTGCNFQSKTITHFSIPEITPEEIQSIADNCPSGNLLVCTYQHYCSYCTDNFPIIYDYCKKLPADFYVLFTVRSNDSLYFDLAVNDIKQVDSTFNHFFILSDSLYDDQYKVPHKTFILKHYGGTIEGNKYYNYVEKYIPKQFNHDCITPKLILYQRNKGIVFVNEYDSITQSVLSETDKQKLENILEDNY